MTLRVCVVTAGPAGAEPRALRHALAAGLAAPDTRVLFLDCAPAGKRIVDPRVLRDRPGIERGTAHIHHRAYSRVHRLLSLVAELAAKGWFRCTGAVLPAAFGPAAQALEQALYGERADVFIAHNIETLLSVARAAERSGAKLVFDSMEFHSDMGAGQSQLEARLVQKLESEWYPKCHLILAASDQIADALSECYQIHRPLPLYNTPPILRELPPRDGGSFKLYWRNSVIGLGQRGLEDALIALSNVPKPITLHIQGHLPQDGGLGVRNRARELGVLDRVSVHDPFEPETAVSEAAQYTVGLCLERPGCRNHDLTVSNKIFDYMMAGLAVISSDLPGLHDVVCQSGGGLLYRPGCPEDLTRQIISLYDNPSLTAELAARAREFALTKANRVLTTDKFVEALRGVLLQR
jgi:glycosyltransferase involved in cell wall biosynthesis